MKKRVLTRRELFQTASVSAAGIAMAAARPAAAQSQPLPNPIPIIHTTDLYHPPGDPDDHVDLATLFALPELDPRAVILDHRSSANNGYPADPGFVPVAQLGFITGRAVPTAVGPFVPLKRPDDPATDRPMKEQAGIRLMLRVLEESPVPVLISVMGSACALTAAFNRDPDLLRRKVRAVLLNAGSTGEFMEWNVNLDPAAYIGLFRSGLPIHWYPCATEKGPFDMNSHNSFWRVAHRALFKDLPQPLCAWFCHGFTGNLRGDIIRALDEQGMRSPWENVLCAERNLWSTASLVLAAGRVLAKTGDGWRFLPPADVPPGTPTQLLGLDPVNVTIAENAVTQWSPANTASNCLLFKRNGDNEHVAAMTEALNHLLRSIPV